MAEKKYIRKVLRTGSSLGFSIPKDWVDKHKIEQGDLYEMIEEDGKLIIQPVPKSSVQVRPGVLRAFDQAVEKYDQVFRNLKDR